MNPLDEMTGPVNPAGREVRVIERQLPVTVGIGSTLFEIAVYASGFVAALVVQVAVASRWPAWGGAVLWVAAFAPALIYTLMKVSAGNAFMRLQQSIQASASTIGNYQEQRFQILKNVAALVRQSIDLDKDVMKAVAAYRGGGSPEARLNGNDAALSMGFGHLFPQVEAYPELRAHAQIAEAMRQNSYLQREITAARDLYNQKILLWNTEVYRWPVRQIVAARRGFTTRVPFQVSDEAREGAGQTFFA